MQSLLSSSMGLDLSETFFLPHFLTVYMWFHSEKGNADYGLS